MWSCIRRGLGAVVLFCGVMAVKSFANPAVEPQTVAQTVAAMKEKYGEAHAERIEKGVEQVARLWRPEDGDAEAFRQFCLEHFLTDDSLLEETLRRYDFNLEMIYGHNAELRRELHRPLDLDLGEPLRVDYLFAAYDPFAHINEDLFKTKVAFVALLNYPLYPLEVRLREGSQWSRRRWAECRLAQQFARRIPAEVQQAISEAFLKADNYINRYNIYMGNLRTPAGEKLFPDGLRLISHWGLRDELKAQYANPGGLKRQRLIYSVMQRIVRQEIPAEVIDNPQVVWDPVRNLVLKDGKWQPAEREPDRRYEHWLEVFRAVRRADPYCPDLPTFILRRFEEDREIPEDRVRELLTQVIDSPVTLQVARLIEKRLGRKLEPFDIWYSGFKPRAEFPEEKLNEIVRARYPDREAFQADLPRILTDLGFSAERAEFVASHVEVDPSRGAGHAMGPGRRVDKAHLRTRIGKNGMDYKGYNIAIHEFGHNVEQVFSSIAIDYFLLRGVPNTAFTEAFAFVFQSRDLALLGLHSDEGQAEALRALDTFWSTVEIGSVALVDMAVWHWMYEHPHASPAELRQATLDIARQVWNEHLAGPFRTRDVELLAIYSHMIDAGLYLPDYPLGFIIQYQIESYLKGRNLGAEMERMCRLGALTPDEWMRRAVGSPISAEPLIRGAAQALQRLGAK